VLLARQPSAIGLDEIFLALEGPISVVDCTISDSVCDRSKGCVTRGIWREINSSIEGILRSYTLEDLTGTEREISAADRPVV
jgi:DNA-binding IscR family transcriptional regulator